ncbi:MAG: RHS repeat protein [Planctomycetes bacterium]|nr:RHS repeat protein [Planctomycetota bacterium]
MQKSVHFPKTLPFFLFAILILSPLASQATVKVIFPTDDTYVDAYNSNSNYGAVPTLDIGTQGPEDNPHLQRAYLKFDLSAIPASATINSATLYLEAKTYTSVSSPTTVDVHNVTYTSWNEMTLFWDTLPNTPPLYIPFPTDAAVINAPGLYSWNVTNDVAAAHGVALPYSAVLKLQTELWLPNQPDFIQFDDRTNTTPPRIEIDYTLAIQLPPHLDGAVIAVEVDDSPTYMEYDVLGEPDVSIEYVPEEEETLVLRLNWYPWNQEDEESRIMVLDPNHLSEYLGQFDLDLFGRPGKFSTKPRGSGSLYPTEMHFDFDIFGNLSKAKLNQTYHHRSWTLSYDSKNNLYNRVLETVDNTSPIPKWTGGVDYFHHIFDGKLLHITEGATGTETYFQYDPLNRLTRITLSDVPNQLHYIYNPDGALDQYQNDLNPSYNCTYNYSYDPLGRRITKIASQTVSSDPAHTRLGHLALTYHSNGTLHQIGYTSNEAASPTPLFDTLYAYDNLGRVLRIRCISHDPDVPSIIVTLDPDLPTGDYMLSRYIYDHLGRHAWTVDSCGYITRNIYHQNPAHLEKSMLQLRLEEPNQLNLTSYEYDGSNLPLRATDLKGNFTRYEYDSLGNRISSCVVGPQGGGSGGALGQVFNSFAFDNLTPDASPRFRWDQYGNFEAVLEVTLPPASIGTEDFGPTNSLDKPKVTLAKNKKNLKNKPAQNSRNGCTEILKGDCNGDCKVNLLDLACLAQYWLQNSEVR